MNPQNATTEAELDALWHNQTPDRHGIRLCRAALAYAKTRCCNHGVPATNCRQHEEEEEQP
jgi:hypothetical protein